MTQINKNDPNYHEHVEKSINIHRQKENVKDCQRTLKLIFLLVDPRPLSSSVPEAFPLLR